MARGCAIHAAVRHSAWFTEMPAITDKYPFPVYCCHRHAPPGQLRPGPVQRRLYLFTRQPGKEASFSLDGSTNVVLPEQWRIFSGDLEVHSDRTPASSDPAVMVWPGSHSCHTSRLVLFPGYASCVQIYAAMAAVPCPLVWPCTWAKSAICCGCAKMLQSAFSVVSAHTFRTPWYLFWVCHESGTRHAWLYCAHCTSHTPPSTMITGTAALMYADDHSVAGDAEGHKHEASEFRIVRSKPEAGQPLGC